MRVCGVAVLLALALATAAPTRNAGSHSLMGEGSELQPGGNITTIPQEPSAQIFAAESADGREEMKALDGDPLDEDFDSPQLGETEAWPSPQQDLEGSMFSNTNDGAMKEQGPEREAIEDDSLAELATRADDPSAHSGRPNWHESEFVMPVESEEYRLRVLPGPDPSVASKIKESRSVTGNDVIEPFDELDEECGSPEPVIPCETEGNSTRCDPVFELHAPAPPAAELMPPEPVVVDRIQFEEVFRVVSVELVDFGLTRDVHIDVDASLSTVIQSAGAEFGISADEVQLARSGGADMTLDATVSSLPDQRQLIVYMGCVHRRFLDKLIMQLPACEDLVERSYVAHIEAPAYKAVYDVTFRSLNETFGDVFALAPIDVHRTEMVTYRGSEASLKSTMWELGFRNNSAFVVYVREPCPTQTASPSVSRTPTVSPSPSIAPSFPSRSPWPSASPSPSAPALGAIDAYPSVFGRDLVGSRGPMTEPAVLLVTFLDRELPIKILPSALGQHIFQAVEEATGKDAARMSAHFFDRPIGGSTILKAFGFQSGDKVVVSYNPPHMRAR